ncbi:hypothetical protein NUQ34_08260 [Glaesserella parasuis]|nr:hypothetical protein [Glaesserella parasuis]EQA11760.1 hypothetical protein HPSD74_0150 [Glaesserella parasuis D74]MDD2173624.1 hypothetical protein [Glaesserella parasuis]MDE3933944.1 hypothetical protein [Glaesserella parasuis]MDE3946092.1 hypothetical protein [Glaesserella parasuis]MDE3948203.1 hypothetical protein [Glaesserella parasuis]
MHNEKMMKNIPKFPPYADADADADTDMLLEALLNKLELEDLVFLLRLLQRNSQAKDLLARKIKKIFNLKLS